MRTLADITGKLLELMQEVGKIKGERDTWKRIADERETKLGELRETNKALAQDVATWKRLACTKDADLT